MSKRGSTIWWPGVLALLLGVSSIGRAGDLSDRYLAAREIVERHLKNTKLNSVYGTPAFDAVGKRIDDLFLNFSGQDAGGRWMLFSLTLAPAGGLTGEHEPDNPRPDEYGHHEKPPLELDAWIPPEEAVVTAVRQHPGHEPTGGVSLAYHWSKDFGGRIVMVLYWELPGEIRDVVLDARYGTVLRAGRTPWPGESKWLPR